MAACLLGIAAWIGVTVLAGALADDPTDPKPTLIAFAAGGTAFFGAMAAVLPRQPGPDRRGLHRLHRDPARRQSVPSSCGARPAGAAAGVGSD
jgi:hypothetical protein